ncbi:MAG: hypothetical protein ACHQ51_14410 [Elusimicrobiota bacterium]
MKIIFAALLLAVSLPAFAQNRAAEIDFSNARADMARARALQSALTAMNDGPEAGGAVSRLLDEQGITVEFAAQPEAAVTVTAGGKTTIRLSDTLPAHPRVYAPLIAAEAAKRMFSGMPACAERSYMRAATAARVFAELGGDFKSLPVVDGDNADAVKASVWAWTTDAQTALEAAGRKDGVPYLADVAAPGDAEKLFVSFLMNESDARRAAR